MDSEIKMSLISICIPTYNGSRYLQEALDSVKVQTYTNIEVIISDDNSKDNTLDISHKFREEVSFPVYIYQHNPSGIGANWNNCIEKANGEFIKFLFQDDVLMVNTLEAQLTAIRNGNYKAVFSQRVIIDENSQIITNSDWFRNYGDLQQFLELPKDTKSYLFRKNILKRIDDYTFNIFGEPDTFLFHKSIFNEVGLFNEDFKQIVDLEFSYRILRKYNILFQNSKLLKFRLHKNQTSSKNNKKILEEYFTIQSFVKKNFFWYLNSSIKCSIVMNRLKYLLRAFPFV